MKYHRDGSRPYGEEVFVFGSNLAGRHGAGAALEAKNNYGAKYGVGIGFYGYSYAIPTKDMNIQTLPIYDIEPYVTQFLEFARVNPNTEFFVTRIGCGLAGYHDDEIAPMFKTDLENISFPDTWKPIFEDLDDCI